jgi:hypothetical protein
MNIADCRDLENKNWIAISFFFSFLAQERQSLTALKGIAISDLMNSFHSYSAKLNKNMATIR